MKRLLLPLGDWTWDQYLLILGPIALSILLVALYAGGLLAVGWPTLLVIVALINLAGDIVYAVRNERRVKRGDANLRNDMIGRRAVAEQAFTDAGRSYQGMVTLAGERWRAVSDRRVDAGESLSVTGRRGLVLDVSPERH